jgi:ferredoxin/flavodoxin---NADP+ reductase
MQHTHTAVIRSNREIAPGAFILTFGRSFDFTPGQVIGLGQSEEAEPRLYSIASGNQDPLVKILYTVKPDGLLTPGLSQMKPGDTVWHTEPFGKFIGNEGPAVWIATGTGIAPFASMLFSGLGNNKKLIYGNRFPERLFFHKELQEQMPGNYHPCTTRVSADGMFHGRVTRFVEQTKNLDLSIPYYLCGNAEMVVDMRDLLIEKGVPFDKIIAEIFF